MDFGKRLRTLREEKKISRDDLSKRLNISYSAVAKYETNVRFPNKETLSKIANFFNVSVDFLLGRSNIRQQDGVENTLMNEVSDLAKMDPDLIVEICRAKNLPSEVRKRLKEIASYEIDKFLWEQDDKRSDSYNIIKNAILPLYKTYNELRFR